MRRRIGGDGAQDGPRAPRKPAAVEAGGSVRPAGRGRESGGQ
jgi:hypothetical protein